MPDVKDLMTEEVITISPSKTVLEAARLMRDKAVGCLVVCEGGQPVGIVSERDLLTRVTAQNLHPAVVKVSDIMSRPIISIDPDASVRSAAKVFKDRNIRRLPVVKDGKLIGIITVRDVTNSIILTMARYEEKSA